MYMSGDVLLLPPLNDIYHFCCTRRVGSSDAKYTRKKHTLTAFALVPFPPEHEQALAYQERLEEIERRRVGEIRQAEVMQMQLD